MKPFAYAAAVLTFTLSLTALADEPPTVKACFYARVEPGASCALLTDDTCEEACVPSAYPECEGVAECEAEEAESCTDDCAGVDGALFCDGQYIAVAYLEGCLEYLEQVGVDFEGSGSAACEGETCEASGQPDGAAGGGSAESDDDADDGGCAMSTAPRSGGRTGGACALALVAALVASVRRRRS